MRFLLALMLFAVTALAQDQRIELTTAGNPVVDLSTATYDYGSFQNHTFRLGYNSDSDGNKIISDEPNFVWRFEPLWMTSGGYHTEIYVEWTSSNGFILKKRPWGMNIVDATGDVLGRMQGRWSFFDNAGAQTASWLQEGFLDFYTTGGAIRFRNNSSPIRVYNAAMTGSLTLIKLSNQDHVVLSPDGAPVEIAGTLFMKDGTMKSVTYDKPDSCGLGYKCIRIEN